MKNRRTDEQFAVPAESVPSTHGTNLPFHSPNIRCWVAKGHPLTSAVAGILVSWSVDTHGHVFPDHREEADEFFPHVVVDRDGVEWTVREMVTPQAWARAPRCLVLNSRECVRRVWEYPGNWRSLDADRLLRLGRAD